MGLAAEVILFMWSNLKWVLFSESMPYKDSTVRCRMCIVCDNLFLDDVMWDDLLME